MLKHKDELQLTSQTIRVTTVFTHLKCRCEMSNNHFIATVWSNNNQIKSTACKYMVVIAFYFRDSGQSLHSRRKWWLFGSSLRNFDSVQYGYTCHNSVLCGNREAYLFTAGRGDRQQRFAESSPFIQKNRNITSASRYSVEKRAEKRKYPCRY